MMSRLYQLSAALDGILTFAKPGEMFEKYSSHSAWVQDQEASKLRRAVTKRKIPEGAKMISGVPHIEEVDAKGLKSLRPLKANEMRDVGAFKREKHKLLIKAAQPELEKKLASTPTEAARVAVKREHLAGIRKQIKQPPSETYREIANLRGSMASELRTTHKIIGGIRDEHERHGLPRPIGIPGNKGGHGIDRPLMISENLPTVIHEAKGRLKTMTDANIQHRTKRAGQLEGALRKRIATGIQHVQKSEGRPPHPQNVLNSKAHEAMEPFLRKVPPNRAEYGSVAGYIAKPGQRTSLKKIEKTRSLLDSLREGTGTHAHQKKVEDHLIKSGKIFEPIPVPAEARIPRAKSFPHLRKIGIGVGVAAAGATALIIKKRSDKKKKSQSIEFARGDIYTAVKTNLIGGTKMINLPGQLKKRVSLRIAAAKGDAAGFRERAQGLGMRKMQIVGHRMKIERDRAASELRGLRVGASGVRAVSSKLETANAEVARLRRKVDARGSKISKLRGDQVSPSEAFRNGQVYGETIGAQREALKSAEARGHFDREIKRVAGEKDATYGEKIREIRGGQRKKIAIGTTAGISAGGVAGYEAGKERKKRKIDTVAFSVVKPNKSHPEASVAAHAITGGLEGAAGIYATDPLLEFLRHGRKGVRNPMRDTFRGHVNKISTGAVIGALATAPIGWAVERERRARRARTIQFAAIPSRGAVAGDRYRKQIKVNDQDKAASNYLRSGAAGAAISVLLRKRTGLALNNALLAGAGSGLAVQGATRIATSRTKDQFGDRSYPAKRADKLPSQIGGAAVVGILGHRALRKFKFANIDLPIQFERRSRETIQAEKIWTGGKRAGRFLRDIKGVTTGKPALDARGRPKTKEWEKPWVKNLVGVAILGASLKGVHSARKFVHGAAARDAARGEAPGGLAKLSEVVKSGALRRAAENKIPGVRRVNDFFSKAKSEVHDAAGDPLGKIATRIEKAATQGPRPFNPAPGFTKESATGAITHAPAGSEAAKIAERRRQQALRKKIIKTAQDGGELSSKTLLINLAEIVDDWDVRDPRGRSARVYAPGSQRRTRRKKRFHEREDNKRIIHQAELGGAAILGTLLAGGRPKPEPAPTVHVRGQVIPKKASAIESLLHEARLRRV